MYPNIKFGQIQKAVNYFLPDAPSERKGKAEKCPNLVKFGMANMLVAYEDQYLIYRGDLRVESKSLTISGFELACLHT